MGRILADFKASQICTLFVTQGQTLNADELPAEFQSEFHLVLLAPFKRLQYLGGHVQ